MTIVVIDTKKVLKDAIERLKDTYDLVWVSYDDKLSDEQIKDVLDGDWEKATGSVDDWASEHVRPISVKEIIDELIEDDVERAALEDDTESYEELRIEIEERDTSDPFGELLSRSGRKLWRYRVEWDWDYDTGEDPELIGRSIAKALGVDYDDNRESIIDSVINCEPSQCSLWVIWYGEVSDMLKPILDMAWSGDGDWSKTHISWTDPSFVLLCTYNGSGMDGEVTGDLSLPFDPERLFLDRAEGQGWGWDETAGVVMSAYSADAEIIGMNLKEPTDAQ